MSNHNPGEYNEQPIDFDAALAELTRDYVPSANEIIGEYEGDMARDKVLAVLEKHGLVPESVKTADLSRNLVVNMFESSDDEVRTFAFNVFELSYAVFLDAYLGAHEEAAYKTYLNDHKDETDEEKREVIGRIISNGGDTSKWLAATEELLGELPLSNDPETRAGQVAIMAQAELFNIDRQREISQIKYFVISVFTDHLDTKFGAHDDNMDLIRAIVNLCSLELEWAGSNDEDAESFEVYRQVKRNEVEDLSKRMGLPEEEVDKLIGSIASYFRS